MDRPTTGQSRFSGLTLDTQLSRQTSLAPKELEGIFTFEGVSHDLLLSNGKLYWEPITVDIQGTEAPGKYCVKIEKFVIGVRVRKIRTVRSRTNMVDCNRIQLESNCGR
ncbi:Oidioi.mRNA.OKI2018_I69.chr2.g5206.t1.cds [Oikopleura dioica]|uniref:Oidioi.mRNA.OKI2018_I69.chr2.g5206.t1.cds n=1 Tax=Oikopleura dioica TaxID=34765 RepID=A0ABN7T5A8_OIKDI|nr:Oidioi.mRNA.OKI2018_I69.chr2.g5206.t1.cds [Oikopleura dioica]